MWKRYLSENGITLLEVVVAVAIASIALVSIISLVSNSLTMEDYARRVTEASAIAENRLKEIELESFPETGQTEGLVDPDDPSGYFFRQIVKDSPIEDVRLIEMEIFWDNRRSSVLVASYLAKRSAEIPKTEETPKPGADKPKQGGEDSEKD
jgi:general secretion pathway protein I